jgi:ubiquitin C-terminal hydrolase
MNALRKLFACGSGNKEKRASHTPVRKTPSQPKPAVAVSVHKPEAPRVVRQLPPNVQKRRQDERNTIVELNRDRSIRTYSFISALWMRRWVNFTQKNEELPGPIDNKALFTEGKLKLRLEENKDFVVISKEQYDCLRSWYGGDLALSSYYRDIYRAEGLKVLRAERFEDGKPRQITSEVSMPSRRNSSALGVSRQYSNKLRGGRDASTADRTWDDAGLVYSRRLSSSIGSSASCATASKTRLIAGLYNPSNYCFMNSALQCLFSVTPFTDYFLTKAYRNDTVKHTRFSNALAQITQSYFQQTGVVRPESLWRLSADRFHGGRQQDLPEFLRFLLESLESELKVQEKPALSWEDYEQFYNQMLVKTFGGQTVQEVTCARCKFVSKSYEIFTDVVLDLSPSVEHSLYSYTAAEFVKTNYKCEKCARQTDITKQTHFLHLPNFLILQIKRFETGSYLRKSNAMMCFSSTMTVQGERETASYQLLAVAVHSGSLGAGHYVAYGLREGSWYLFNDSSCSLVAASQVLESQAYLLIYAKSANCSK